MNKTISINIPHHLSKDEARRRLQNGIADLRTKYANNIANVAETWTGDRMEFRMTVVGQAITGRMDVLDESVKLDLDLPWLLATFAEKFRPTIEQEGRKLLEKH